MIKSIAILALLSITGCAGGTYFKHAEVYGGVGRTVMDSPNCLDNGSGNPSLVGLLGARVDLWTSMEEAFRLVGSVDHTSCLMADDGPQSDMVPAVEAVWRLW